VSIHWHIYSYSVNLDIRHSVDASQVVIHCVYCQRVLCPCDHHRSQGGNYHSRYYHPAGGKVSTRHSQLDSIESNANITPFLLASRGCFLHFITLLEVTKGRIRICSTHQYETLSLFSIMFGHCTSRLHN
jgi:hypothetical protein